MRTIAIPALLVAVLGLTGCGLAPSYRPVIDNNGTGAHSLDIAVPLTGFRQFKVSFFCTSGTYSLLVLESPKISMVGLCGERVSYSIPVPPVHVLHLEISLKQDSIYFVRGGFGG